MDDLKLMRDAGASMSPRCKMGFDRADNGTVSRVNPHIMTILRQIIHIRAIDSDSIGLSQNHPLPAKDSPQDFAAGALVLLCRALWG